MSERRKAIDPVAMRIFGRSVDFGRTAKDYATQRAGFPQEFFELLGRRGFATAGQRALDVGCGTGTIARGLAHMRLDVTGVDPAQPLLKQAQAMDHAENVVITYKTGHAEDLPCGDQSFDLVTAGQCWHWFDRDAAACEAARVLRPGGRLVIAHFDWLPQPENVVASTEALILAHNPAWTGANGSGIYPDWLHDMKNAGFASLETASFDVDQPYSHAAWRARIRASAGIAASLNAKAVHRFDEELEDLLARDFPQDPLSVPHRVWLATGLRG